MSSAPITPTPTQATSTFLTSWITFVKAHEKLLIVALSGFLIFHFYSKVIDAWVGHDKLVAQQAASIVKADDTQTLILKTQLAGLQATVEAQNAIINKQIAANQASTKKQQQTDATLSPSELAARLAVLLKVGSAEVTTTPIPGHLDLSPTAAVTDAQQLETIPELQSEVSLLRTELANDNTIITKQGELITQLNKDIVDEKASHTKDVNELKAQNHKSWLNGFKWGIITGTTLGLVAHHAGV